MMSSPREYRVRQARKISTEMTVPGDKSISHRALMLASLSNGECEISGLLPSSDCLSTLEAMRSLGVRIDTIEKNDEGEPVTVRVHGVGGKFVKPEGSLDCGNSGTTMRLMAGILAAQDFETRLTGDASLSRRPMRRVIEPLEKMGASITAEGEGGCAPLVIKGGALSPIHYDLPVASAQVKSCILLAGMLSHGRTSVTEPAPTRDHTERMLDYFLVKTRREGGTVSIRGPQMPESRDFRVPGDISSAAFWLVAAAAQVGSRLTIRDVGLNPTRSGILQVLVRMGANISDALVGDGNGEPVGNVTVRGRKLKGIDISGDVIPNIIDELPIIAVAAALAEGTTSIRGAEELRVKETDRIQAVADNLELMGVTVRQFYDGMEIDGGAKLKGARIPSYGDHRIAMSFAIAGLFAEGETVIDDTGCVATSYPGFERELKRFMSAQISAGRGEPTISAVFTAADLAERERVVREHRKKEKAEHREEKQREKERKRREKAEDEE